MMREARSRIAAALLAALLLAPLGARAEFSAPLQALIEAARQEGAVSLMFGEGALGGSNGARLFETQMNDMFGTRLKISYTPGPAMPVMGSQIAVTLQAKRPAPTDIYVGWSRHMAGLYKYDLFRAADWEKLLPTRIDGRIVEGKGTMLKAVTSMAGMYYNPQQAPMIPRSLVDFLRPEWKGKIATTPYAANFDVLAAREVWGPEKAIDYARKLNAQIAGLMRCDEGERIASGEFLALVPNCSGRDAEQAAQAGAPIVNAYPLDFRLINYTYIAVPKNAPHPNAGTLFAVFCMTPEGQKIIRDSWGADLHFFPDSKASKEIAALEAESGHPFPNVDVAWQLENSAGNEAWGVIQKILSDRR
jgi:ABC-type Fe3+ transport system substrate-binding protein